MLRLLSSEPAIRLCLLGSRSLISVVTMSERHLAKGEDLPPLEKGKLRIYSMVICPFAQRTRMVLAHKNIPHETVNVDLRSKPDWFLERNPLGLVPTLEKDGQIVYESGICDDYLDEVYPDNKLVPQDPYDKARQRLLMEGFSKVFGAGYRMRGEKDKDIKAKTFVDFQNALDVYEKALKSDFFGGEKVAMVDIHIWPWIERYDAYSKNEVDKLLPEKRYPKLRAWMERMYQTPAVKATLTSTQDHQAWTKADLAGAPDYTILDGPKNA